MKFVCLGYLDETRWEALSEEVMKLAPVLEACAQLEVPERVIPGFGAALIAATLIYAFPRTSLLGAIVLTGSLGGATWIHVRVSGPALTIVFPGLVAAMIWGGLYPHEPRLRALVPSRRLSLRDHRVSGGQHWSPTAIRRT